MRAVLFAIVVIPLVLAGAARGDEFTPDWLPPLPPRQPIWDIFHETPVSRPGEEFSDLLIRFPGKTNSEVRFDPGRYKLIRVSDTDFGKVSSNLDLPDPSDPRLLPYRDWKAAHSLNLPLRASESVFMFGNFDSSGSSLDHQMVTMKGRSGLGVKMSPFDGSELQVRTGTLVSYADTYSSAKATERSQLSVELQAKLALFGPLQLQYAGEALPAMIQTDRHTLLSDLKLALPFGTNRELYLGAKYKWEDTLTPTPWVDRAQLYLGVKFQR